MEHAISQQPRNVASFSTSMVSGRYSAPMRLTPKQAQLLEQLVDDKVTVGGREFTRSDLLLAFKGVQIPKDPDVRKLLDVDASFA